MPTLREMLDFVCQCAQQSGQGFADDFAREIERQIRSQFPAERIYIPPPGSRKDPGRAELAAAIARTAPTAVIAERLGITRRHARRIVKKGTNPDT